MTTQQKEIKNSGQLMAILVAGIVTVFGTLTTVVYRYVSFLEDGIKYEKELNEKRNDTENTIIYLQGKIDGKKEIIKQDTLK